MEFGTGCAGLADGVGERNIEFTSEMDDEEAGDTLVGAGLVAGRGVDTPSALASFANLCGGSG